MDFILFFEKRSSSYFFSFEQLRTTSLLPWLLNKRHLGSQTHSWHSTCYPSKHLQHDRLPCNCVYVLFGPENIFIPHCLPAPVCVLATKTTLDKQIKICMFWFTTATAIERFLVWHNISNDSNIHISNKRVISIIIIMIIKKIKLI